MTDARDRAAVGAPHRAGAVKVGEAKVGDLDTEQPVAAEKDVLELRGDKTTRASDETGEEETCE